MTIDPKLFTKDSENDFKCLLALKYALNYIGNTNRPDFLERFLTHLTQGRFDSFPLRKFLFYVVEGIESRQRDETKAVRRL